MKFANYEKFVELYEKIAQGEVEAFNSLTKDYLEELGSDPATAQKKSDFISKIAFSLANIQDEKVLDTKIKKASREISYDTGKMEPVKAAMAKYLDLKDTSKSSFMSLWDVMKVNLSKLSESSPTAYEKVVDGIVDRKTKLDFNGGIETIDFFEKIATALKIEGEEKKSLYVFLDAVYNCNIQTGKTKVGKGEYLLDFFLQGAEKDSDVKVEGKVYEIKVEGAAVGQGIGGKRAEVLKEFSFLKQEQLKEMSFGKQDFRTKWWPVFKEIALEGKAGLFLEKHAEFVLKSKDNEMIDLAKSTLQELTYEKLVNFYTQLCIKYIKKSLDGKSSKSMIIFNKTSLGKALVLDNDSVEKVVGFAAKEDAIVKIKLPMGNETGSRPEIAEIKI
jgi:hypothetical protein